MPLNTTFDSQVCSPAVNPMAPRKRRASRLGNRFGVLLSLLCLLSFGGCLGRDYDEALRRITIPGRDDGESPDRMVINAADRFPSASEYGLRWTNGNQTYTPARGNTQPRLTAPGTRWTGSNRTTYGRSTNIRRGGPPGLGTDWGKRQTGIGRVTNPRGTNPRPTINRRSSLPGSWQGESRTTSPRIRYRDR